MGITFSEDLKWKTNVNNTSKKANYTLGFLRRNLRHCPLLCRKNAYLALVRSKLEYGSVVWDPYLKNDIDRLERVQRSAARFITGDYKSRHEGCVTNMLDDLDLPSLEERRRQQRLTFLYKVVKGHVPAINIDHYLRAQKPKRTIRAKQFEDFVKKNIVERSVCNNNQCFKQLPAKSEQFRNSFFVRTTHDWNILIDNIVNCDTVESFRTLIAEKSLKFARSTPLNKCQDWLLQRTVQIQIQGEEFSQANSLNPLWIRHCKGPRAISPVPPNPLQCFAEGSM